MTKSEQIMSLYDGQRTTSEIAAIVGCRPSYVRVVARQRQGKGLSDIDRKYRQSPNGSKKHAASQERSLPYRRAYMKAYQEVMRRIGDAGKAREAGRAAFRKAMQS